MADEKPCEHCGTASKPRSFDRWDNWLCDTCATAEAEAEWED
jgi:hypothetical protein